MTRNDIICGLMDITHEMASDIERIYKEKRPYSADEVMDIINSYAERLIGLRRKMGSLV